MKEAVVILTLLGCNHAETRCEYIETDPVKYTTIEDCYFHSQSVFEDNARAAYPVVMARCEAETTEIADLSGAIPETAAKMVEPETRAEMPRVANAESRRGWLRIYPVQKMVKAAEPVTGRIGNWMEKGAEATGNAWQAVRRAGSALNPF